MLIKLLLLFGALILLIYGIYKACEMDYEFDHKNIDEYPPLCSIGGILWVVGLIIMFIDVCGGFNGNALKIGFTFLALGVTMFVEPFIHYLIKFKN